MPKPRPRTSAKRERERTLVVAPLDLEPVRVTRQKYADYEKARAAARLMKDFRAGEFTFIDLLQQMGFVERKRYGLILSLDKLTRALHDPQLGHTAQILYLYYMAQNPNTIRASHTEALKIIKQLAGLGFPIKIQKSHEPGRKRFVKAATMVGAKEGEPYKTNIPIPGTTWARDQWVKIDGKKERPHTDMATMLSGEPNFFGEGGSVVQVGPKEFVIHDRIAQDPRVEKYERKGYKFHPMPMGVLYDRVLSDLFGTRIFVDAPHVDFSIGGIPELKLAAVCPRYERDHRMTVQLMEDNLGVKVITVPEEEADRHPQNFLPLGKGRVLVDSGAPEFIKELRAAGTKVIPTKVPLNALLDCKGSLHCLFNEE